MQLSLRPRATQCHQTAQHTRHGGETGSRFCEAQELPFQVRPDLLRRQLPLESTGTSTSHFGASFGWEGTPQAKLDKFPQKSDLADPTTDGQFHSRQWRELELLETHVQ
jgi:hypothetical protein